MHKLNFKILWIEYDVCSIRHELGGTGLLKKFNKSKSVRDFLYMILVFSGYASIYSANILLKPLLRKDFEMSVFAQK